MENNPPKTIKPEKNGEKIIHVHRIKNNKKIQIYHNVLKGPIDKGTIIDTCI